jgi:hypothetical protein
MRTGAGYHPTENYLGQRGWQHVDQMGNQGIYKKPGQKMRVSFGMFSRKFMICQADIQP